MYHNDIHFCLTKNDLKILMIKKFESNSLCNLAMRKYLYLTFQLLNIMVIFQI